MKGRFIIQVFLSAFSLLLLGACNEPQNSHNGVKIGVILPLTGNFAVIGEGEKKGIDLALDELKRQYPDNNIEVVYEDFASDTKNAATAANKLISVDGVDAIITSTTAASEAVSPIVDRAQKIHFVISPDIEIVSRSKYNFRVYYNLGTEADVVGDFVKRTKPVSAAFLATRYSSLQKLVDDRLEPDFKNLGMRTLAKEYVEVSERDFKTPIVKLRNENPNLIFLAPMTNQVDLFTNQLRDAGINPSQDRIIVGSFTFNWKPAEYISTLEGYYIATPIFQTFDENNAFTQLFFEKYNIRPSFDMAFAYDNVKILTELLINSKKDFEAFKVLFNDLGERSGAAGKIRFTGDNDTAAEIAITKIVNGKQVPQ